MFRKTGYIYGKVYVTGWHFMDFPMPQLGDFELMVRGRYEGGDGPIRKIRIQGKATKNINHINIIQHFVLKLLSFFFFLGKASMTTPTSSLMLFMLLTACIVGL